MPTDMRLSNQTISVIKELALSYFGRDSKVYIFGSQIDDRRRGGDIDIYVETFNEKREEVFDLKIFFRMELKSVLGERKIDVVINNLATGRELPIYSIAREEGVQI
jgi:predicted nucleotidyltransferase